MTRKDGGTAFPMQDPQAIHAYAQAATEAANHERVEDRDQSYIAARAEAVSGLSIRDYFAARALPIAADRFKRLADAHYPEEGLFLHPDGFEAAARAAYSLADAMLAARSA